MRYALLVRQSGWFTAWATVVVGVIRRVSHRLNLPQIGTCLEASDGERQLLEPKPAAFSSILGLSQPSRRYLFIIAVARSRYPDV